MDPKQIGWRVGLIIALAITWFLTRPAPKSAQVNDPALVPLVTEQPTKSLPSDAVPRAVATSPYRPPANPVAAKLNAPTLTAQDDVANVHQLLEQMFGVWKPNPRPMSLNAEFTAALMGDNPVRMPFLPPNHPAIKDGLLTDRWGQPYQFHLLSMDRIEVRSAGPDQQLYTEDDALYSPWTKKPVTSARAGNADAGN